MNRTPRTRTVAALAGAGLLATISATGCSADRSAANDDPAGVDTAAAATSTDTTESASPGEELDQVTTLSDTFDDDTNGWALPPSEAATSEVVGGDFVIEIKEPGLRPHFLASTLGTAYDEGRLEMTDVRVTATATPKRGAAAFGLFCREVPDTDADFQWYEFVVRDGYSAIRLADSAGNLETIVEGDASVPVGQTAELEIECQDEDGAAALSLSLNGEELLQTTVPEPLGNGAPGVQAYDATAEESDERMLLAWHDFAVEPAA